MRERERPRQKKSYFRQSSRGSLPIWLPVAPVHKKVFIFNFNPEETERYVNLGFFFFSGMNSVQAMFSEESFKNLSLDEEILGEGGVEEGGEEEEKWVEQGSEVLTVASLVILDVMTIVSIWSYLKYSLGTKL